MGNGACCRIGSKTAKQVLEAGVVSFLTRWRRQTHMRFLRLDLCIISAQIIIPQIWSAIQIDCSDNLHICYTPLARHIRQKTPRLT